MKILNRSVIVGLFFMLILSNLGLGSDFHHWSTGAVTFDLNPEFRVGMDVEIRYLEDMYYHHFHFDLDYKLSKYFTIGLSERESYIKKANWMVEHKPMFNVKFSNGWLKNRARVTLRIRDENDIWRFRNKTTLLLGSFYAAYELFMEQGKSGIFRSRYYAGVVVNKNLSMFLLRQNTGDVGIWVIGTKLTARI